MKRPSAPSPGGGAEGGRAEDGLPEAGPSYADELVGGVSSGGDNRGVMYTPTRVGASTPPGFCAAAPAVATPTVPAQAPSGSLQHRRAAHDGRRGRRTARGTRIVQDEVVRPGGHRDATPVDGASRSDLVEERGRRGRRGLGLVGIRDEPRVARAPRQDHHLDPGRAGDVDVDAQLLARGYVEGAQEVALVR